MNMSDFNIEDFKSMKDTVTAKTQTNTNSSGVITPAMRLAPPASTSISKSSTNELPGYDVFGFHVPVIVPTWMQSGTSIGDALKPVQKPAYDINNWANSAEIAPYIYTAGMVVGMTDNPPGSVETVDRVLSIVYNKMPGSAAITKGVSKGVSSADYVINLPGKTVREYRVNNITKKLTAEYADTPIDTVFIRGKATKIADETDPFKTLSIRNYRNKEQAEAIRMDALRYEVAAANRRESNAMINQEIEQLIQEDPDFGYAPRQKKYQGIVDYPNLDDMVEVKTRPATADEIKNYVEYSDRKSAGRFCADARGAGIEGILHQFLHDAGGAFDDLPGGDLVHQVGREDVNCRGTFVHRRDCRQRAGTKQRKPIAARRDYLCRVRCASPVRGAGS
jgi:hypothetical protein